MIGLAILLLLLGGQDSANAAQSGPIQKDAEPIKPMLYRTATPADRADAVRTMQRFSACVVARLSPARLNAYLRLPPGSSASNRAMAKISTDMCAPNRPGGGYELRFQPNVMRAAVYDSLYRMRYRTGPVDVSRVPKFDFASEFDASEEPVSGASFYFRSIGDCVARARPALAHDLLMTRQGSKEEGAAMKAIVPSVAPCVPQGSTLRFSAPVLRGDIAEALYKLSVAAGNPPRALAGKVEAK
jgi:hypothetical protein